jgi:hypothetical protein
VRPTPTPYETLHLVVSCLYLSDFLVLSHVPITYPSKGSSTGGKRGVRLGDWQTRLNDSSSITSTSDPSSRHRSHPISSTSKPDLVRLSTHRSTAPLPYLHARLCTRMRPPGFLSIALRRGSNASQSSVEDDSQPTTPGPATAPRPPGFDYQGEADTGHINPNAASSTTDTIVSSTDRPVSQNQTDSRLRQDLDLGLESADRKAKESVKVHYFPKDKPVYSCRKCLVPIVRPHLCLYSHRYNSWTFQNCDLQTLIHLNPLSQNRILPAQRYGHRTTLHRLVFTLKTNSDRFAFVNRNCRW